MFENYPKIRQALPDDIKRIYASHYKSNRDGSTVASGLAQKLERWMHIMVSADVAKLHNQRTLEVGAGTLNHLTYESSDHYDIVEPFEELYSHRSNLHKIGEVYSSIEDIDSSKKYDRIISIATFEHIVDLPSVVARSCLLLDQGGVLRVAIPNEGTFLWTLGWKLTTGIEFRLKYGMNYGELMRHEHVNSAQEIEEVLAYFYDSMTCKVLGLNKQIGLYRFYACKNPNMDRVVSYLKP